MGMGIDHCIHCAFKCLVLKMLPDGGMCCVNYIHGKMYIGKALGLENITLGVQKMSKRNSSRWDVICTTS